MMLNHLLLPWCSGPPGLRLDLVEVADNIIALALTAISPHAPCPLCSQSSRAVHSFYDRTLADLPWAGVIVRLHLHVRRFFCRNPSCRRIIFTERLPQLTASSARRTYRLRTEQRHLALHHGGEAAARTARRQGMPVSPRTLLRLARQDQMPTIDEPAQPLPTPRILGVDDFAFRKGQTYGTILVDLERHCPVDLLPDRSAETLARWLQQHPGVQVISRDRAPDYADGATRGAPQAIQVADRFHLMQNVREMLQRLLERHQASLRAAVLCIDNCGSSTCIQEVDVDTAEGIDVGHVGHTGVTDATIATPGSPGSLESTSLSTTLCVAQPSSPIGPTEISDEHFVSVAVHQDDHLQASSVDMPDVPDVPPPLDQHYHDGHEGHDGEKGQNCANLQQEYSQMRRASRLHRYIEVRDLHSRGLSVRDIACRLHMSRRTVRHFVVADQFPERATRRKAPSKLDPYLPYLQQQLAIGHDNGMQLWREIRDQHGYKGSRALVGGWVAKHRHLCPILPSVPPQNQRPKRRGRLSNPGSAARRRSERILSARQASWLLFHRTEELEVRDRRIVKHLCERCPDVQVAYSLAQDFIRMVRECQASPFDFDEWLVNAKKSGIREVRNFAAGLERDKTAVVGALSLPYSNGQTEGQVGRLKFIKRSGYGRAKLDLLRQRVLMV